MSTENLSGDFSARGRLREFLRAPRLPIDLDALEWNCLGPGVRVHLLESDPAGYPRRALIWADVDAEVPEHTHDVAEDTLVLEGTVELIGAGEGLYPTGTIFHSPAGTIHTVRNAGSAPCLCYVVYGPPIGD